MIPANLSLNLRSAPTLGAFVRDHSFIRVVIGPVGSGKSTCMCAEITRRAFEQQPAPDGIRYFKAAIVRNTGPELKSTTMQTWRAWIQDDAFGPIVMTAPPSQRIRIRPKGRPGEPGFEPGLDLLVEFLALDRPKDVKKLLSWEGTLIWFNELREIEKPIWDQATLRVGRYPSLQQGGVEPSWYGIIGDTNPPDEDHWLHALQLEAPDEHRFFVQPPAVIEAERADFDFERRDVIQAAGKEYVVRPAAENLAHLPGGGTLYYRRGMLGKSEAYISVYLMGKTGFVQDGKACVPSYNDNLMMRSEMGLDADTDLFVAADVGGGTLNPAALFMQRAKRGNWLIHAEVVSPDMGVDRFADQVLATKAQLFPDRPLGWGFGDPSGAKKDEIYETIVFEHLRAKGIPLRAAPTNAIKPRLEAYERACTRLIDGKPGLLVHRRCTMLRAGLSGKWRFRKLQIAGTERYSEAPEKNVWSHPCDAGGYGLLGGGEHRDLMGRQQSMAPVVAQTEFNVFEF